MGPHPKLVFERVLHESITAVECGLVSNANFDDVVVSTYSGKVIAFSSQPGGGEADEGGRAAGSRGGRERGESSRGEDGKETGDRRIRAMRSELEKLRLQVEKAQERCGKLSDERGAVIGSEVQFKLNDKWVLAPDMACYQV